MLSGQCTMGVGTKVSVRLPRESVSPAPDARIAEVAVVSGKVLDPRARGGADLRVRRKPLDERQAAAVVGFGVVGDNDIDLRGVDDGADAREHLFAEALLHRVDEGHFFVEDKVGVVGGAFFRFIAVEVAQVPVDRAHPIDVFGKFERLHGSLLSARSACVSVFCGEAALSFPYYYIWKGRESARDFANAAAKNSKSAGFSRRGRGAYGAGELVPQIFAKDERKNAKSIDKP